MRDLNLEELSTLLEKEGISEKLEFIGRVNIDIGQKGCLDYTGKASIEPTIAGGAGHYFLSFNGGRFNFKPTDKFKIDFWKSSIHESGINYRLSALVVPIDIAPGSKIVIDMLSDIKY